ncbi:AmmeMemoRadiSam system radical SAM enzyme [Pelosinus sp. sgz500959]|uniref:AmmeMemoRadiSam system radical SAM enzyme n=1 Tax=Pelosinus sp. sgz500959 TaxID=3242472 RepID=UPI00366E9A82
MREAMYYQSYGQGILCSLCPKGCIINEGQTGFCRARENISNKLYTKNYAGCTSCALDPIEKKPLYHFYPGSLILSLGTWGCNFSCSFCQNWQIAQELPSTTELLPPKAVEIAKQYQAKGNIGIAYTYSEPSVWYEYVLETAQLIKEAGLKNVLVTNGFINPEPLKKLLPYIDGMNIDVKAFNKEFYQTICAGGLEAVKETVELAVKSCHVEITTLLIPGLNDEKKEITKMAQWLAGLNSNIPLHFSRYFPNYKMNLPPTSEKIMKMAKEEAEQYLNYVYLGNMNGDEGNTNCPQCNQVVIDRTRSLNYLQDKKHCPHCGHIISMIGEVRF